MDAEDRTLLAERQGDLVRALRRRAFPPQGLDVVRFRVARRQLEMKRWRAMAKTWPELARELGERPPEDELQILGCQPLDPAHPGLADGLRLAGWLEKEGKLGPGGRRELLVASLAWRLRGETLQRRRARLLVWSRTPDELLVGVRIPWLPVVVWRLSAGRMKSLWN